MTIGEARAKAHQQYDDCMFCPGCSKLLAGLHMESRCCTNWIEKKAQKLEEKTGAYHHRAGNSSNNRNRDRLSHGRSQKQTQGICAE